MALILIFCFPFFVGVSALTLAAIQQKGEQNLKRKHEKGQHKGGKKPRQKKNQLKENNSQNKEETSSDLSESDKQLLERWENMRKTTKPFIHPIRKYMNELKALKDEILEDQETCDPKTGQKDVSGLPQAMQQFQFTQFVPQDCNGNITTLKAVKIPYQVTSMNVLPAAANSHKNGE